MALTQQGYKGIRGVRYRFMMDHMPEQTKRLEESGGMDDYLHQVEHRYLERRSELQEPLMKQLGVTEELKRRDYMAYSRGIDQAADMAEEIARKEIIEAI